MLGRFTSRRIVAPEPVPAPEAIPAAAAAAPALAPEAPVEPEPLPEAGGRGGPLLSEKLLDAKVRLHRRLIEEINLSALEKMPGDEVRRQVHALVSQYTVAERLALNAQELEDFVTEILDEMMGLGPIEPLLKDATVNDILINGHEQVYVERRGVLEPTLVRFAVSIVGCGCSRIRTTVKACSSSSAANAG
jgi:pilus assembly protein CpaF